MKNQMPKHWQKGGLVPLLLSPASFFYARGTATRLKKPGYRSKAKIICIGNVTAGGAGKTPTAIAVAQTLQRMGKNVHFITTGYGRKTEHLSPIRVKGQPADEIGDEPLLLAQIAPTWVGDSRELMAKQAEKAGAEIIIMDDGFQNPEVEKDFSIIVVDGGYGFGNGKVIPSGPLREPVQNALARADAIMVIGNLKKPLPEFSLPVFSAKMEIEIPEILQDESVVAFCGIGRPEKFFDSLRDNGVKLVEELAFPDHHYYNETDFKAIFGIANSDQAVIVTTEKDMVKVPERFRKIIYPIKAHLEIEDEEELAQLITKKLKYEA